MVIEGVVGGDFMVIVFVFVVVGEQFIFENFDIYCAVVFFNIG